MESFILPIFPEGALAHSVTTCVWVGVMIIVTLNLRFGWVLSGLVVPGYLAPLILVKPWAAGVVVFEALVTYWLAYWFSERGARLGYWSALFGRDRFFSLIVISVIVRLFFDTWFLPEFAGWLEQRYEVSFDFRNNLHSFGLIIICLMANQFWKTGFIKGLLPVVLPIVLTCLVIRYGFMEFTNFSIGNLNYIYEDIAASIIASPKSYMILILAAFIASRMNLHYGWDYNGILIPALLALQWYQPEKVLISFLEAFLILGIARAVMRLPWLAQTNLEGGRKLLLFFNISFAYKFIAGWIVLVAGLDIKTSDYFGFGYLLTTLIAVKMHDKEIIARLSRATLQTSLTAVVIASVFAFGLSRLDWGNAILRDDMQIDDTRYVEQTRKPLAEFLEAETLAFYQHRSPASINKPLAVEIDRFTYALELLRGYRTSADRQMLGSAAAMLHALNFDVIEHADWLLLKERAPSFGWGTFVLAQRPQRSLTLEVPAPLESGHLSQISAHLFDLMQADALALAGNHIRLNQNQDPLSTMDQTSLFHAFHRFHSNSDVLQLRGVTQQNRKHLGPTSAADANLSELRIAAELPAQLDLRHLYELTGRFETYFSAPDTVNIQREAAAAGFAELYLTDDAVRKLLYASIVARRGEISATDNLVQDLYVREWVNDHRGLIAAKDSNAYQPLSAAELLYFDEQILTPMRAWIATHRTHPASTQARTDLAALDAAAGIVRHSVRLITRNESSHLALRPASSQPVRHSALLLLRVEPSTAQFLEVPRPLSEPGTIEFGIDIYTEVNARGLLIAGAHPAANRDGTADLTRAANKNSLFSLANQHLVRAAGTDPLAIVHVRGLGYSPRVLEQADVLVSERLPFNGETLMPAIALQKYFADRGLRTGSVDGSWSTWGYENHFVFQNRYLEQSSNKTFRTVWVPAAARKQQRFQSNNKQLLAQLTSLGVAPRELSLRDRVLEDVTYATVPKSLEAGVRQYQRTRDVVQLHDLIQKHSRHHFETLIDRETQQVYLLVGNDRRNLAGAFLLGNPAGSGRRVHSADLARALPEFVENRESWILWERSS